MSALVYLRQKNRVSEDATFKTKGIFTFKSIDTAEVDDNGILQVPSSSLTRSYEIWLRLYMGAIGPGTAVYNPRFYAGTNYLGTGVTVYARTTNASTYSTPAIPADDTAGTSIFTYTAASPKALDAVNAGPFSTLNADFGDYLVLWMTLSTSVVPPFKTDDRRLPLDLLTFQWDEA